MMADSVSSPAKSSGSGTPRPKRVVTSRACDSCRTRRIRCVLPDTKDKSHPCKACTEASIRCTFDSSNKRRGPLAKRSVLRSLDQKITYDLSQELDAFCAKAVVEFLVQSYLDHMYPLAPAVHATSFFADFKNDRQSHDLKFFSLLISTLLATVCTLPGALERCKELDSSFRFTTRKEMLEAADRLTVQLRPPDYFDDFTLDQWAYSFLMMMANAQQGMLNRAMLHKAQCTGMFKQMNLHRISTYHRLDKIEQQRARKALWMNFTSESHMKLYYMETEYMHTELTHLENDADLLRPLEVDDEYITVDEVFPQPAGEMSLVAGLNALSAMNRTWMEPIVDIPLTAAHCHQPNEAVACEAGKRIGVCECGREVSLPGPIAIAYERLRRLERCLDHLPPELAVEPLPDGRTTVTPLRQSQYDTLRSNIHVTHFWAQNILVEFILGLLSASELQGSALVEAKERCSRMQAIIACKLLRFLDTLPKVDLLPNGLVLIVKIRSVGASLLQDRSVSEPASDCKVDQLIRSFATLLVDLDLEHGSSVPDFDKASRAFER